MGHKYREVISVVYLKIIHRNDRCSLFKNPNRSEKRDRAKAQAQAVSIARVKQTHSQSHEQI